MSDNSSIAAFTAGGFGGVCAVLVGHPFDLVKVRLQNGHHDLQDNALKCLKNIIRNDGYLGLYRGVIPPLLGVTPMFAVSFWSYDTSKRLIGSVRNRSASELTMTDLCFAGLLSAVPTTVITAPMERVKVMLQIQGSDASSKSTSPTAIIRTLYQNGGISSIYRGSMATLARDGYGSAVYFGVFEYMKRLLAGDNQGDKKKFSSGQIMAAGGAAGAVMWTLVFPIDVVKTQLQASSENMSVMNTVRAIHAKSGMGGFFKGLAPALLRAYPANAVTFLGYELVIKLFSSF